MEVYMHEELTEMIENEIKKGDELLQNSKNCGPEILGKIESHYCKAIKLACDIDDYYNQILAFQKLGAIYEKQQKFTKAASLYNYSINICRFLTNNLKEGYNEKSLFKKIAQIQTQIERMENNFIKHLTGEVRINEFSYSLVNKNHKKSLNFLRLFCKEEVEKIEKNYRIKLNENNFWKTKEHSFLLKLTKDIEKLNKRIADKIKFFMLQLIDEAMQILGNPPCKYTIIGLGSLARFEITPYSDIEWAILIDESDANVSDINLDTSTTQKPTNLKTAKDYFVKLTHLVHFKVINLGETLLPSMAIKGLNSAYPSTPLDNWFHDDITLSGFKFDGFMPSACKTPFGTTITADTDEGEKSPNGDEVFSLIQTPSTMAQFQYDKWYIQDHLLPKVLQRVIYLTGDQGLFDCYTINVNEILNKKMTFFGSNIEDHISLMKNYKLGSISLKKQRALSSLERSLQLINKFHNFDMYSTVDFKHDIYRLPSSILEGLCILYNIDETSISSKILRLVETKKLNDEGGKNYMFVYSMINLNRLSIYLHNDSQKEIFYPYSTIAPQGGNANLDQHSIADSFFENILGLFIPLCEVISDLITNYGAFGIIPQVYHEESRKKIKTSSSHQKTSPVAGNQAEVEMVKQYLKDVYGTTFSKKGDKIKFGQKIYKDKLYKANDYYVLGLSHLSFGRISVAIHHFKSGETIIDEKIRELTQVCSEKNDDIHKKKTLKSLMEKKLNILNRLGLSLGEVNCKEESRNYHEESLKLFKEHFNDGTRTSELAGYYQRLAVSERQCQNIDKAITYYNLAIEIVSENDSLVAAYCYTSMSQIYLDKNDIHEAISCTNNAVVLMEKIGVEKNLVLYARCIMNYSLLVSQLHFIKVDELLIDKLRYAHKIFKHQYGSGSNFAQSAERLKNDLLNRFYLFQKNDGLRVPFDLGKKLSSTLGIEEFLENDVLIQKQASTFKEKIDIKNIKSRLLNRLGLLYFEENNLDKSACAYKSALELMDSESTPHEIESKTNVMHNLADIYRRQGKLALLIPLMEKILSKRREIFNPTNEKLLNTLVHMGIAYSYLNTDEGRIKAKSCFKEAIKSGQQCQVNLANIYADEGIYDKAIAIMIQYINDEDKNLSPKPLLFAYQNLFIFYMDSSKLKESQEIFYKMDTLFRENIDMLVTECAPDKNQTANMIFHSHHSLACLLYTNGKVGLALHYLLKSIDIYNSILKSFGDEEIFKCYLFAIGIHRELSNWYELRILCKEMLTLRPNEDLRYFLYLELSEASYVLQLLVESSIYLRKAINCSIRENTPENKLELYVKLGEISLAHARIIVGGFYFENLAAKFYRIAWLDFLSAKKLIDEMYEGKYIETFQHKIDGYIDTCSKCAFVYSKSSNINTIDHRPEDNRTDSEIIQDKLIYLILCSYAEFHLETPPEIKRVFLKIKISSKFGKFIIKNIFNHVLNMDFVIYGEHSDGLTIGVSIQSVQPYYEMMEGFGSGVNNGSIYKKIHKNQFKRRTTGANIKYFIESLRKNSFDVSYQLDWLCILNGVMNLPSNILSIISSIENLPTEKCKFIAYSILKDKSIQDLLQTNGDVVSTSQESKFSPLSHLVSKSESIGGKLRDSNHRYLFGNLCAITKRRIGLNPRLPADNESINGPVIPEGTLQSIHHGNLESIANWKAQAGYLVNYLQSGETDVLKVDGAIGYFQDIAMQLKPTQPTIANQIESFTAPAIAKRSNDPNLIISTLAPEF